MKGSDDMTHNGLLTIILLVAMPAMFIWRQLLKLVAVVAVAVFCLGLYQFAQIIHL